MSKTYYINTYKIPQQKPRVGLFTEANPEGRGSFWYKISKLGQE